MLGEIFVGTVVQIVSSSKIQQSTLQRTTRFALLTFNSVLVKESHIIQLCSRFTSGRVFNGELNEQRLQKLLYLHLFTDCFMQIALHSSEQNTLLLI